jgi:hypothetical protein
MADDYQRFREVLVEMHRTGGTRRDVSAVLPTLTGQKKIALYHYCPVEGLQSFS